MCVIESSVRLISWTVANPFCCSEHRVHRSPLRQGPRAWPIALQPLVRKHCAAPTLTVVATATVLSVATVFLQAPQIRAEPGLVYSRRIALY